MPGFGIPWPGPRSVEGIACFLHRIVGLSEEECARRMELKPSTVRQYASSFAAARKGTDLVEELESEFGPARTPRERYSAVERGLEALAAIRRYPPGSQRRRWSLEAIRAAIREREEAGSSLAVATVVQEDRSLVNAAYRYFGDWFQALEAAGVDPAPWKDPAGRGRPRSGVQAPVARPGPIHNGGDVIGRMKARARGGASMEPSDVLREEGELLRAANVHFGSWERAVAEARLGGVRKPRRP